MKRNRIGSDVLFREIKPNEEKGKKFEKWNSFNVYHLSGEGSNANGIE